MDFFSMRSQDIEAMAERHYDRLLDEYLREDPEPWETDEPEWADIMDLIDVRYDRKEIAALVRDYIEGDGDIMVEIFEAGLLKDYVDPSLNLDDPDDEWREVDRIFCEQWDNDDLFVQIYIWLPEKHMKAIGERLIDSADHNGIRELYNKEHEDDWRYPDYDD